MNTKIPVIRHHAEYTLNAETLEARLYACVCQTILECLQIADPSVLLILIVSVVNHA